MPEAVRVAGGPRATPGRLPAGAGAWLVVALIALASPGLASTAATAPGSPPETTWKAYGESEASFYFYDTASVRVEGELRRVWRLFDFRAPADNGVRSGMALVEIHCANQTYRYLRTLYFDGTRGHGKYLGGSSEPQFDHIAPGSMIARLARTLC